ncbi:hypothetical protein V4F39_08115 [Aquincola sp. MAHUQ-54]|uniref:Nitrogen fixation protein FixH n=1 Tax=Aquincola agrisoli TaxID=3119538 RepID=A0AAW9QEN3_9BURK
MNKPDVRPVLPWWRVPMVWLVIGGPAVVVVAGIATAVIALRGADVVIAPSVPRAVTQWKVEVPGTAAEAPAEAGARP